MPNNKDIARRIVEEGWNKGKIEVLGEACHKDYVGNDALFGKLDLDGYKRAMTDYRSAFSGLKVRILQCFGEGDFVTTQWESEGTHSGVFVGVPGSQKTVKISGVNIAKFRDGKIIEDWMTMDGLSLLQQIGVVPKDVMKQPSTTRPQATIS